MEGTIELFTEPGEIHTQQNQYRMWGNYSILAM
jgi:hypothetical protein